ncbi:hypothetical protein NLU13_9741 [Sarocladium strictum]|uniref:Methyltransferase n=1 Tax=Sarocladium strictum TaxID=5046 RepID=A0AA39GAN9_SARSR|nr:hypothetical protein NLU13_9741 [Sarocladium strictum]
MESGPNHHSSPTRMPSPASTGSALAVGSSEQVELIKSLEQGEASREGIEDDTRSLTDSIREHIVAGGLRYHAYHAGSYSFPNDETEQYRDELKHNVCLHLCEGAYFYAPIQGMLERGGTVLDLGTGTGKWVVELADMFPKSEFHGVDLSPIQPDWVPENVSFVVDDIEHEAGWAYPENYFDYIHIRHCVHSLRDRKEVWNRIYKHLKPGGFIEIHEFEYIDGCDDDSCSGPFAWRDFIGYLERGMACFGANLHAVRNVESELVQSGFKNVWRKSLKCPIGPWAKKKRLQECGHIMRDVVMWGLNGLARKPFRDGLGWTPVQIEMFLVEVRKGLSEEENGLPKHHTYFPYHAIYARKPFDPA